MRSFGKSDVGRKRKNNEDSFFYSNEKGVFIIADGMGGHLAGEEASKIAVETAGKFLSNPGSKIKELINKSINTANSIIFSKSEMDPAFKGMGTTLTCAIFNDKKLYIGHVGDSRLYMIRNNSMTMITDDHSQVWKYYKEGLISKEEARTHPLKSVVTRAVGIKPEVLIDTHLIGDIKANDLFLLCTDGLTDMVTDDKIKEILLLKERCLEEKINMLISRANKNGGKDNISIILFQIEKNDIQEIKQKEVHLVENKSEIRETGLKVLYNKKISFRISSGIDYY